MGLGLVKLLQSSFVDFALNDIGRYNGRLARNF